MKEAEAALLDAHGSQEVLHSGIETAHTNIAVQEDRNLLVAAADFFDEGTQLGDGLLRLVPGKFLVVDRQDESRSAALLLRKRRQVAVAGHADDLEAFDFDGFGQRTNAETRSVLRTEVLVDDDDRKVEAHGRLQKTVIKAPKARKHTKE